jgi:hypothetical protein
VPLDPGERVAVRGTAAPAGGGPFAPRPGHPAGAAPTRRSAPSAGPVQPGRRAVERAPDAEPDAEWEPPPATWWGEHPTGGALSAAPGREPARREAPASVPPQGSAAAAPPRSEPIARRHQPERPVGEATAPPTIQVTIGRVEVRASTPAAQPDRAHSRVEPVGLDDYLRQRSTGGGGA